MLKIAVVIMQRVNFQVHVHWQRNISNAFLPSGLKYNLCRESKVYIWLWDMGGTSDQKSQLQEEVETADDIQSKLSGESRDSFICSLISCRDFIESLYALPVIF